MKNLLKSSKKSSRPFRSGLHLGILQCTFFGEKWNHNWIQHSWSTIFPEWKQGFELERYKLFKIFYFM